MPETRQLLQIPIRLDGQPVNAETRWARIGPWTVYLTTCLPDHGIELHSTYTGAPRAQTHVHHLALAPRTAPHAAARDHDPSELPVWHNRRRCLLEHLSTLQARLAELGHRAQLEVTEDALRELDG